jgi:hypothetical protein
LIQGTVSTHPVSWGDPKGRAVGLNAWITRIAKEVGAAYQTKTERDAAVAFVKSHRLSIANAFERKIVRGDVVKELTRLFREIPRPADVTKYNFPEASHHITGME